ncbi:MULTISPECIES: PLDc N-terminal domain-containing protein [unclassified Curtobacterium]|uniref:PLDc N-terminal domain-containing protein n=1 Tax=unclassified Curtobacterium TaxID=257496 RepID=UPI000DAA162B|nr:MULTISPECIES: PLDc N-terminal domain-containing protein [unclassified Curtobacterium]PZE37148.1 hypothetical protein DEJ31_08505 [Curtobacterium sp. MCPF17_031]PZF15516.1 hypothetical protein DEJ25_01965 [Curtobacterium sp. MCPF17_011]
MHNAVIPQQYDTSWTIVLVAVLALMVAAVVSVVRNTARMTLLATVVWVFGVIVLPVLGSLVWFFVGRRDLRRRSSPLHD